MPQSKIYEDQIGDPDNLSEQEFDDAKSNANSQDLGAASPGTSETISREDHVHKMPSVGDLSDVDLTGLQDGDKVKWNATSGKWEPASEVNGEDPVARNRFMTTALDAPSSNPAFPFGMDGSSFEFDGNVTLQSVQFQFKQNNSANMQIKVQVWKWDGATLLNKLIFEHQAVVSGVNGEFRRIEEVAIQTPGEETLVKADNDRMWVVISNNAGTGGAKQIVQLGVQIHILAED